jgi:hypothetical protein
MAGGHIPAIAPLMPTAFAAGADAGTKSDFRVCSTVAVMVTPSRAGNDRSNQASMRRRLAMLQRDMKTGVPCILRSGATRVLQDCRCCATTAIGLWPVRYPPLRTFGRPKLWSARSQSKEHSRPISDPSFRLQGRRHEESGTVRTLAIAFAERSARARLRGTSTRMPAKAPVPASSIEFERPARSSNCLRTKGRTRRASP